MTYLLAAAVVFLSVGYKYIITHAFGLHGLYCSRQYNPYSPQASGIHIIILLLVQLCSHEMRIIPGFCELAIG